MDEVLAGPKFRKVSRNYLKTKPFPTMYAIALVPDLTASTLTVKPVPGVWCFLLLNRIKKGDAFPMFIWVNVLGSVDLPHNLLIQVYSTLNNLFIF